MKRIAIALVGERNEDSVAHRGIPRALSLAGEALSVDVAATWIRSDAISDAARSLAGFAGVWVVPGSLYASMAGALAAIRHSRVGCIAFLGTCGGFQHALIEYARAVVGIADAEHAESTKDAQRAIIVPLECPLIEVEARVRLAEGSRLAAAYGSHESNEEYQCRFGLDEAWRERLAGGALVFTAFDDRGRVRGAELRGHPFFVATLFQPERAALRGVLPPLVKAFVRAAAAGRSTTSAMPSSKRSSARRGPRGCGWISEAFREGCRPCARRCPCASWHGLGMDTRLHPSARRARQGRS